MSERYLRSQLRTQPWIIINGDPKSRPPEYFEYLIAHIEMVFWKDVLLDLIDGWRM